MASGDIKDRGTSRLIMKLEEAFYDKKYYEAHQLVRTINFRYQSNKVPELEDLLIKTGNTLLDAEQYESGIDVGNMLTKLYLEHKLVVDESRVRNLTTLVQKMHESPERGMFIANVIEWSSNSRSLIGEFNYIVARMLINEKSYQEAWKHLVRMTDVQLLSDMVWIIVSKLSLRQDEIDLVVAILVLTFLADKRFAEAESVYSSLASRLPSVTPLVNALRFTIEACKTNQTAAYLAIKQVYWPNFNRDPNLIRLFHALGRIVFKIPTTTQSNGLMDNLLAALAQPDAPPPSVIQSSNAEAMTLD